jgi:proteasome accessory factor B
LPLSTAIESCSRVSFDYLKPGEKEISVRNIEPWSLQNISGQWLLVGFDLDREQPRNFLLKRIVSEIDIQDVTFDAPESSEVTRTLAELELHKLSQNATLRTSIGSAAWFHFDLAAEQTEFKVNFMDLYLFAEELMEFADELEVVEPKQLSDLIKANLQRVCDAHA